MNRIVFLVGLTSVLLGCRHASDTGTPCRFSSGSELIHKRHHGQVEGGDAKRQAESLHYTPRELEWVTTKLQAYVGGMRCATNFSYTLSIHEGRLRGEVRVRVTSHSYPADEDGKIEMLGRIMSDIREINDLISDEVQVRRHTPWSSCAILELTFEARGEMFPELKERITMWNEPFEHMRNKEK